MKRMWCLLTLSLAAAPAVAHAEPIFAISVPGASTNLLSFDSSNPAGFNTIGAISGIVAGHTLRGVDFRPSNGLLYAVSTLGTAAQLYTIDLSTGAATTVGAGFTLTGTSSTRVSLDFNPVVDALRVVTGSGQNYRVNADTGALIAQDANIVTVGSGATPLISGIAYTNNLFGAVSTTLYAYDFLLDNVGTIGGIGGVPSPNTGQFNIVGNSGFVSGDAGAGFDISGATGFGYLSFDDFAGSPGFNAEFFMVNLLTGAATQIGADDPFSVLDFSVQPTAVPEPATLSLMLLGAAGVFAARRKRA